MDTYNIFRLFYTKRKIQPSGIQSIYMFRWKEEHNFLYKFGFLLFYSFQFQKYYVYGNCFTDERIPNELFSLWDVFHYIEEEMYIKWRSKICISRVLMVVRCDQWNRKVHKIDFSSYNFPFSWNTDNFWFFFFLFF